MFKDIIVTVLQMLQVLFYLLHWEHLHHLQMLLEVLMNFTVSFKFQLKSGF